MLMDYNLTSSDSENSKTPAHHMKIKSTSVVKDTVSLTVTPVRQGNDLVNRHFPRCNNGRINDTALTAPETDTLTELRG